MLTVYIISLCKIKTHQGYQFDYEVRQIKTNQLETERHWGERFESHATYSLSVNTLYPFSKHFSNSSIFLGGKYGGSPGGALSTGRSLCGLSG